MTQEETAGPLASVRVLEVGTHRAGAFTAAILADLGADVVKVETETGPESDEAEIRRVAFDRGKRSIGADLSGAAAADLVSRLVARSAVVIEEDDSWRTGQAGAGADLAGRVHCTITPFGDGAAGDRPVTDPDSEDLLVQALSGNMDLTGFEGGPPCEAGIPVADLGAGVFAAIGVLAGVVGGGPRRVEVAKLDVAVALLSYMAVGYFADGEVPSRVGTGHSTIFPYNAFRASDGEIVVAPFTQRFWRNFATAVGREDLAHADEYRSFGRRLRAKEELLETFAPLMAERSVDDWARTFAETDVPSGPVLGLAGALDLEHTAERQMTPTVTTPDGTTVRTAGSPFRFATPSGASFRPTPGPVPRRGAHTAEVDGELRGDRTAP